MMSCTILDNNKDAILLVAVACFMRKTLNRVNGFFEVTSPAYFPVEFENLFWMTRETCEWLSQEIMLMYFE